MKYTEGNFKYQLREDEEFWTGILPETDICTEYIDMYTTGKLIVREGFVSDGPSGPTIDTENALRAAVGHDALCDLISLGRLSLKWREEADALFFSWLLEDGMDETRATVWYKGVKAYTALLANDRVKPHLIIHDTKI